MELKIPSEVKKITLKKQPLMAKYEKRLRFTTSQKNLTVLTGFVYFFFQFADFTKEKVQSVPPALYFSSIKG